MSRRAISRLAANIEAGEFSRGEMPMTPDRRIQWTSHFLPGGDTLLLPLKPDPEVISRLAFMAMRPDIVPGDRRGNCGVVGLVGDVAVKSFRFNNHPSYAGLPAVQAHIALHAGFEQEPQVIDGWRFRAPQQHGALLRSTERGSAVWVMEWIFGVHPEGDLLASLPPRDVRAAACRRAVGLFGVPPNVISTDGRAENTLVGLGEEEPRDLIKLDIFVVTEGSRRYSLVH